MTRKEEIKLMRKGIFPDWEEAYNYCREANAPIIVKKVMGQDGKWKIFPSGRCEDLLTGQVN
jgi:hypothetical protein